MALADMSAGVARLRLLPATMCGIAALLAVKSAGLIADAYGAAETPAVTAPAEAKPEAKAEAETKTPASPASPGEAQTPTPAPAAAPPQPVAVAPMEPPPSPAERALLMDLRKRRTDLDARAAAMEQREALLKAAEKQIATRVDQLTSLQTRLEALEALEAARRDRDEASWRGLVRVYETMKPKDAAVIFNDLDSPVMLQVVDRMKDGKAAAIMAVMAPDRARKLTDDLAVLRSRANAPPEAPPTMSPASSGGAIHPANAALPATTALKAPSPGASP